VIKSAMQTPDGAWRVEVVKRGRSRWFRVLHGDSAIDWLAVGSVERILGEAGVDLGSLVEADDNATLSMGRRDPLPFINA
jgi:hypothetical protein